MKIYVYNNARIGSHDLIPDFYDTTPMSIEGRKRHFTETLNVEEADIIFMGQISCGTMHEFKKQDFLYLDQFPNKHVVELEGDWLNNSAEQWVAKLIKSGNSSKPEHLIGPLCVRPPMSNLLVYLGKTNPEYDLEFPEKKSWCFRGFADPLGVRQRTVNLAKELNLEGEYEVTNTFGARSSLNSSHVSEYILLMHRNILSLCPRGAGIDTIRFYEACYFGRVPVAISDAKWMGEDFYDMSFAFRLSPSLSDEQLKSELIKINNLPLSELIDRGHKARDYFQTVVVNYFKDPTKFFLNWCNRHHFFQL